jgi:hypothetical protein
MTHRSIVLQELRSPQMSQHISAQLTVEGNLVIEGQDLGAGVESFWGKGHREYEWYITVRAAHIPQLIAILGGMNGDDVLSLLEKRYAEDEKYASISFLKEQGVPVEFWSRVGD